MLRAFLLLAFATNAYAQDCPPVNAEEQKAREQECRATGGAWSRFGVHAHLCNVYSCAPRTLDAGKPCRNRADCEHLCVTHAPAKIGAEVMGECAAVKTTFGCFTHVDGGKIVGRVCVD